MRGDDGGGGGGVLQIEMFLDLIVHHDTFRQYNVDIFPAFATFCLPKPIF